MVKNWKLLVVFSPHKPLYQITHELVLKGGYFAGLYKLESNISFIIITIINQLVFSVKVQIKVMRERKVIVL